MNLANGDSLGFLINWLPMLLLVGVWVFFMRQMRGRGGVYGNQQRMADALERIAAALEKRQ